MRDERGVILSSEQLRTFQINLLEIMVEVDRICRRNGIYYSLDGGTLLGAIRHKGFIPWDDDADIIFTRTEYEKFYLACYEELDQKRFFLQDYRTDPEYRWGYAKLRRKGTEFVRLGQEKLKYRTGMTIDIFVLDNVPDGKICRDVYYGVNYSLRKILYSDMGRFAAKQLVLRLWYRLLHLVPKNACFLLRNWFIKFFANKRTKLLSHLLFQYPASCISKYGVPAKWFEVYQDIVFEGFTFYAVREADSYLKYLYGDYMKMPPEAERVPRPLASCIEMLPLQIEDVRKIYNEGLFEA